MTSNSEIDRIGLKGTKAICKGLKRNAVLEKLMLCTIRSPRVVGYTDIDESCLAELAAATRVNLTLKELCLRKIMQRNRNRQMQTGDPHTSSERGLPQQSCRPLQVD